GLEWQPLPMIALRTGYKTDTTKQLSAVAGVSAGLALTLWGQELAYAWVPYGDLGDTQYISIILRFGEAAKPNNLHVESVRKHRYAYKSQDSEYSEEQQLNDMFNDTEQHRSPQQNSSDP